MAKMKMLMFILILVSVHSLLLGQISVSPWQIHEGKEGIITHISPTNGDPSAYPKAAIPVKSDNGWKEAPKNAEGKVFIDRASTVKCLQQVDFTYFQTVVDIPANTKLDRFSVYYDKADDGARIYIFNSKFPAGTFNPDADLMIHQNNAASVDLKDKIVIGEPNRIVIVQFDDCADRNSVTGININVNGYEIKPKKEVAVPTSRSELTSGGILKENEKLHSSNKSHYLLMQSDGNLCIYTSSNGFVWGSMVGKGSGCRLVMQADGNLVVFDSKNQVAWSTGTQVIENSGSSSEWRATRCTIEDNGTLCLYTKTNQKVWSSKEGKLSINTSVSTSTSELTTGGVLKENEKLYSSNKSHYLLMQSDGNLCIYTSSNGFVWGSMVGKGSGCRLVMQADGNLVVFDSKNQIAWSTGTQVIDNSSSSSEWRATRCAIENNGTLCLYTKTNQKVWSSKEGKLSTSSSTSTTSNKIQGKVTKDVTVETYGIFGKGRANDPAGYYFLQQEGAELAKIKVASANTGGSINVERAGNFVYFNLSGTTKYLKFVTTGSQVKWVEGKDDNAKWKEIAAIQPGADQSWKSYVLSTNESLFLRHTGFIMYAHTRQENATFYGDATWRIEGGMLVPPAGTANTNAYGKKQLQTYAIGSMATNNFFVGIKSDGAVGVIDRTNPSSGSILSLEVRFKASKNSAVVIDSESGKYVTTDASGNITLTADEQEGSYWTVTAALQGGLDNTWFSLKSNLLPDRYIRHDRYTLYAHVTGYGQHFNGDASWKFVE
jgi:hypothetical protein